MPISFIFLSRKKKKEVGERKKKKQVRSYREKSSHNASRVFGEQKDVSAIISTKMLVKHSHFRNILSVFSLDLSFRELREQLGSISCTKNREPAYASAFSACRKKSTTVFLSSFWSVFPLSFSKERRKMRKNY